MEPRANSELPKALRCWDTHSFRREDKNTVVMIRPLAEVSFLVQHNGKTMCFSCLRTSTATLRPWHLEPMALIFAPRLLPSSGSPNGRQTCGRFQTYSKEFWRGSWSPPGSHVYSGRVAVKQTASLQNASRASPSRHWKFDSCHALWCLTGPSILAVCALSSKR
jgi:hypothetical protein